MQVAKITSLMKISRLLEANSAIFLEDRQSDGEVMLHERFTDFEDYQDEKIHQLISDVHRNSYEHIFEFQYATWWFISYEAGLLLLHLPLLLHLLAPTITTTG